jgi:hypothetical protein
MGIRLVQQGGGMIGKSALNAVSPGFQQVCELLVISFLVADNQNGFVHIRFPVPLVSVFFRKLKHKSCHQRSEW